MDNITFVEVKPGVSYFGVWRKTPDQFTVNTFLEFRRSREFKDLFSAQLAAGCVAPDYSPAGIKKKQILKAIQKLAKVLKQCGDDPARYERVLRTKKLSLVAFSFLLALALVFSWLALLFLFTGVFSRPGSLCFFFLLALALVFFSWLGSAFL